MSEEATETLNVEVEETSEDSSTSYEDSTFPTVSDEMETPAEEPLNTGDDDAEDEGSRESPPEEAPKPFHERDEWKELQARMQEREQKLEQKLREREEMAERRLRELEDRALQYETMLRSETPGDSFDVTQLSADQIQDLWSEDPKGFLEKYGRQVAQEVQAMTRNEMQTELQRLKQEQDEQRWYEKTLNSVERFADEHPDFMDLFEEGAIEAEIQRAREDEGRIIDFKTAYHALTMDKRIEEARTEAEKKFLEEQKKKQDREKANREAKQKNRVLGASPAHVPGGTDPRLAEPEKYGGRKAVLTARLKERMRRG